MIDASVFVARGAVVLGDVAIGRDSSVWFHAVVRGDTEAIRVGEGTNLQDLVMVHADPGFPCLLGSRVTVGHRAIVHGCTVEDDCLIGMGAIVLNGARIGAGSVVGAGALVGEGMEVPAGSVVVGVPGRILKKVDELLRVRIDQSWRHYVAQARRHREGLFPMHGEA